jgi:hypothetical protein
MEACPTTQAVVSREAKAQNGKLLPFSGCN